MRAATNTTQRPQATRQSLVAQKAPEDKPISYKVSGKDVELSVALTQAYFCKNASPAEAYIFNQWCAHVGLDPWKKQAYLVKYGSEPAQHLTAINALLSRAYNHPKFQGLEAGIIVKTADKSLIDRVGEIYFPDEGEEIVGGWCKIHVKDYVCPMEARVDFRQRCQYKDGKPMAKWKTSPGLMIRKCSVAAAIREAFPEDTQGMYVAEEFGMEEVENATPIQKPQEFQDAEFTPVDEPAAEAPDQESFAESFFDQEG